MEIYSLKSIKQSGEFSFIKISVLSIKSLCFFLSWRIKKFLESFIVYLCKENSKMALKMKTFLAF